VVLTVSVSRAFSEAGFGTKIPIWNLIGRPATLVFRRPPMVGYLDPSLLWRGVRCCRPGAYGRRTLCVCRRICRGGRRPGLFLYGAKARRFGA
jgi:hypothetical protein